MPLRVFTFLFLLCLPCWSSTVELVHRSKPWMVISQNGKEPWIVEDQVCATRKKQDIACGDVIFADKKHAVVEITYRRADTRKRSESNRTQTYVELAFDSMSPKRGDKIRLLSKNPKKKIQQLVRELASNQKFGKEEIVAPYIPKPHPPEPFTPVSDISMGMNLVFPTLQYQQTIKPRMAVGLMPILLNYPIGDGAIKGSGAFVNIDFYSEADFEGTWFQVGLGLYSLTASLKDQTASTLCPALNATLGWRWFWNQELNFGFGVGAQYLASANPAGVGLDFSGILPSIVLDVGFAF